MADYDREYKLYNAEKDSISQLVQIIQETVDASLYDIICKSCNSLDIWYSNLREHAGMDDPDTVN